MSGEGSGFFNQYNHSWDLVKYTKECYWKPQNESFNGRSIYKTILNTTFKLSNIIKESRLVLVFCMPYFNMFTQIIILSIFSK